MTLLARFVIERVLKRHGRKGLKFVLFLLGVNKADKPFFVNRIMDLLSETVSRSCCEVSVVVTITLKNLSAANKRGDFGIYFHGASEHSRFT